MQVGGKSSVAQAVRLRPCAFKPGPYVQVAKSELEHVSRFCDQVASHAHGASPLSEPKASSDGETLCA